MDRWPERMLIQISICLAIIVGLSFLKPSFAHDRRPANAKQGAESLAKACDAFYEEYQSLPLANRTAADAVQITTGKANNIMTSLCNPIPLTEGPKYQNFFGYREAREKKDSLLRNEAGTYAEFFDPWGNPYYVLFDYDYSGSLKHPSTGETLEKIRILVWSPGPDGKTGTPAFDKDNIYARRR
ncbi:MAG: hypothetical protein ABF391_01345 [Akkermansiaceae bacterium]|jgi:hypothetical protein